MIFQSGVSEEGRNLAAHIAEGIFAPGESFESEAQSYYADVKRAPPRWAATPTTSSSSPTAARWSASTDERARRPRSREIYEEDNDFDRKLGFLGRAFGAYDFTQHDLDAPFPDLSHLTERGGRRGVDLVRRARARRLDTAPGRRGGFGVQARVRSSARRSTVADDDPALVRDDGALDGINLAFRVRDELENFVDTVVPILQERGLYRREYESDTLRGNLGLPFPVNRYTAAARGCGGGRIGAH